MAVKLICFINFSGPKLRPILSNTTTFRSPKFKTNLTNAKSDRIS